MWKGHHYIQLPNEKHLFFSESNQANTQGGLSLISQVDNSGNMKRNQWPFLLWGAYVMETNALFSVSLI